MMLHVAIRILFSPKFIIFMIDYAEELLTSFVNEFGVLYVEEYVSYNVPN